MIMITYLLQALSTALMLMAIVLIASSFKSGNYTLMMVNMLTFVANAGLFYWEGMLRASL